MRLPCLAVSQGGTPWTDIDKQKKDFTGNLVLTDRDYEAAELAQYPALEYPATPPIRGVAYRRGVTVSVVWTIQNNHPFLLQGTLNILGARLRSPGPNTESPPGSGNWSNPDEFRTLPCSPATTALTLAANGGSQNVTLTFLGVPNHVCLGDLEVNYAMPLVRPSDGAQGETGSNGGYKKLTRLYVVDAQPTGLQSTPWADVLEYTCRWAWGAVGGTDLKEKMTRGMHYSNRSATRRVYCDPYMPADFFGFFQVPQAFYRLARLTYCLDNQPFWTSLDCRDFAGALQLAFFAQGTGADYLFLTDIAQNGFDYNPLCGTGDDASNPINYGSGSFNFHCLPRGSGVYDAAAYLYDPNRGAYMNPPVNGNQAEHWQKMGSSQWYGLVGPAEDPPSSPQLVVDIVYLSPF